LIAQAESLPPLRQTETTPSELPLVARKLPSLSINQGEGIPVDLTDGGRIVSNAQTSGPDSSRSRRARDRGRDQASRGASSSSSSGTSSISTSLSSSSVHMSVSRKSHSDLLDKEMDDAANVALRKLLDLEQRERQLAESQMHVLTEQNILLTSEMALARRIANDLQIAHDRLELQLARYRAEPVAIDAMTLEMCEELERELKISLEAVESKKVSRDSSPPTPLQIMCAVHLFGDIHMVVLGLVVHYVGGLGAGPNRSAKGATNVRDMSGERQDRRAVTVSSFVSVRHVCHSRPARSMSAMSPADSASHQRVRVIKRHCWC
jgi:hypothetical protein